MESTDTAIDATRVEDTLKEGRYRLLARHPENPCWGFKLQIFRLTNARA